MEPMIQDANQLLDTVSSQDMENKYLTFFCDHQLYAISIHYVMQIVGIQAITEIPEFPDYARGVINLRGNIILVIDTRRRLKKPECNYDERTCIIIASIGEQPVGFIVDMVDEVLEILPDAITAPARASADYTNTYVTGIASCQNKLILVLDVNKLFTNSELEGLSRSTNDMR